MHSPHIGSAQAKVRSSDEAHVSPTQVLMGVCNGTQVDPTENEKLDGLALACTCPRKHESRENSKQRNLMNPWDVFDHPHTMRQGRTSLEEFDHCGNTNDNKTKPSKPSTRLVVGKTDFDENNTSGAFMSNPYNQSTKMVGGVEKISDSDAELKHELSKTKAKFKRHVT